MRERLPARSQAALRAAFGDWAEDDLGGERWLIFAPAFVLVGRATSRKPRDGGIRARLLGPNTGLAASLSMEPTATRVRARRGECAILVGRHKLDTAYVEAIASAYSLSEWRMTKRCNWSRGPHAFPAYAYTTDRLAFAYVAGRSAPVAALAPLRETREEAPHGR